MQKHSQIEMSFDGFIALMADKTDIQIGLQGFKDSFDPSDDIIELPNLLFVITPFRLVCKGQN